MIEDQLNEIILQLKKLNDKFDKISTNTQSMQNQPEFIPLDGKSILNIEEAAELLHIHPVTLSKKAKEGKIPAQKIGREWRFSKKALMEWMKTGIVIKYS